MAKFTIYSKDGKVRYEGEPQYSGSYMSVDYLEFRSISSPCLIDWERGDYIDYYRTGLRYKLYSHPMPKKVARKGEYGGAIEYSNVQFFAATKELEIAPFRDLVPEDNKIHFSTRPEVSTYENVYGVARRIQECVNDIYPGRWRIEVYDTDDADLLALFNETKEYSISNGSCLDALSQIYDTWKNVGWIHTYDSANDVDVITIGRANVRNAENTSDCYSYGIGKGLTSIRKASANEGEFATRLYVYGSERNLQPRYYNGLEILNKDSVDIRNLMLPLGKWGKTNGLPDPRKAYIQADDSIIEKYGLIPRTIYFDGGENEEIYPSIKGLTERKVRQAMIDAGQGSSEYLPSDTDNRIDKVYSCDTPMDDGSKDSVESQRTFEMYLHKTGFDIATQGAMTSEGYATISMLSGGCAGREFKVRKSENQPNLQRVVLERAWDESIGLGYPNANYKIKAGDEFVILDIPMPDYYIAIAEDSLLEASEKMLADYTRVSAFYEPSMDPIRVKARGKLLRAGMFMQVYDEDIIDTEDNTDYVLIDTLTIDENGEIPLYRVTLREQKRAARNYSALEDMIEDAQEVAKKDVSKAREYTDRRFNSAQETISMLAAAFEGFSEGISPITIRTMAMLVGNESNQFKFTKSLSSLEETDCPLVYEGSTKQLKWEVVSYIKHMTLGIDAIAPIGTRDAEDYRGWMIPADSSETLEDGQARYVYIRASQSDNTATFVLSKIVIDMMHEEGYYHFLVGILNSEYDGNRDFVTLYGFTEVLPGQITTDIVRSGNGNLVIDLVNALIEAKDGATIRGAVTIEEGSVMSSRMDVGDPSTGEVEAFFNGGIFALDNDKGKMIIASGISEGEESLEERAKDAATRIYEDGTIDTKKLIAREGELSLFKFSGSWMEASGEGYSVNFSPAVIHVESDGVNRYETTTRIQAYPSATTGGVGHSNVVISTKYTPRNASDEAIVSAIRLSAEGANTIFSDLLGYAVGGNYAIYADKGMFGGLRPRTRDIGSGTILDEYDYNVFISTGYVYLPKNPQTGQTYRIYHTSTSVLFIKPEDGFTGEIRWLKGNQGVTSNNTIESHRAHVLELVFGGVNWYLTFDLADNGNV